MKYNKFFKIIPIVLLIASCEAQNKKVSENNDTVIIDPVEQLPFYIVRKDSILTIPNNLNGNNINGFAVVQISILGNGALKEGYLIRSLSVNKGNKSLIKSFEGDKDHLKNIELYKPYLENYIKSITIKQNKDAKAKEINNLDFMIRFKSNSAGTSVQ